MRIVLLLVATLLVASTDALAQQQRPQLRVLVEDLDEVAAKCGVSKSQLESIATLTLRNNGIQVVNETTNPFLAVVTTFIPTAARGCAFYTRVSVQGLSQSDIAKGPIGVFKARSRSHTVLCEQSALRIGPKVGIMGDMTEELENNIKQCLGQLDY